MTGIDTSFLIPLALEEHAQPESSTQLIAELMQNAEERFALAPLVLAEFVHAVSDPKRFEYPLPVPGAIEWLLDFLALPQTTLLMPEPAAVFRWLQWMGDHRLSRKRVLDTLLAASLHTAGVTRLLTANPRDFRVFGVFELWVPTVAVDPAVE